MAKYKQLKIGDKVLVTKRDDSVIYWSKEMDISVGTKLTVIDLLLNGSPQLSNGFYYPRNSVRKLRSK